MKAQLRIYATLVLCLLTAAPALANAQTSATSSRIAFQEALVVLTNHDRLAQGDRQLTESPLLSAAAQAKADDMATKGYFAHHSPLGVSPWYWFTSVGYFYTHAGENLAMNFYDPASVESVWMASPAHRANILRNMYTQMGVGIAQGTYHGEPVTFIVELFATPAYPVAVGETATGTKTDSA